MSRSYDAEAAEDLSNKTSALDRRLFNGARSFVVSSRVNDAIGYELLSSRCTHRLD